MPVSPHGLFFALLQVVIVVAAWWGAQKWRHKNAHAPIFAAFALILEYIVLRVQPVRMGGDPFEYTLGLFDGVTLVGLMALMWMHRDLGTTPAR